MAIIKLTSDTIECPKCGKHSIVSLRSGEYACLNCDFRRTISDFQSSRSRFGNYGVSSFLAFSILTCLIVVLLVL